MAHDIGFPLTYCARAPLTKAFERDEGLGAIVPCEGHFLADLGDLDGGESLVHSVELKDGDGWGDDALA